MHITKKLKKQFAYRMAVFLLLITGHKGFGQSVFPLQKLGQTIYEGVFTGNGLLGTMSYLKGDTALRIDFGRTDVYDHRSTTSSLLVNRGRIPIGHLQLLLQGDRIQSSRGDMNLGQANANALITAAKGTLSVKATTLADQDIILIEINDRQYTGTYTLSWKPEKAIPTSTTNTSYEPNPDGTETQTGNVTVYNQPFLAGGGYTVAYKTMPTSTGKLIVAGIGFGKSSNQYQTETAQKVTDWNADLAAAYQAHQQWWGSYFAKSALRIPDPALQAFYQMQVYKLGCAARANGPAIDLQGPWTAKTPWPAYWHNLNTQLTYSPVYTANHLEISQSLLNMIDGNLANLSKNVPAPYQADAAAIGRVSSTDMFGPVPLRLDNKADVGNVAGELGNLTWMLYYYYQHYRYGMDARVGNNLFNILKKSVNYYLYLLEKNEQGKYHIGVKTSSPEYPGGYGFDTNYDLAILRWGLKTLVFLNTELNKNDQLQAKWSEVLNNLIDYPKNENGYMIARDIPFAVTHRHYSHLLMIYPFYEINREQLQNQELINKSINHWQSMPQQLQGYSYTGLASMKAMMGDGNAARNALKTLQSNFVKPNTLYAESGPVIETPLSAMTSLQELCLQFWDGVVRVFPAIPSDWNDVSFDNFRTDGAFLISGTRQGGINTSITIKSEVGGRIKISPNLPPGFQWTKTGTVTLIGNQNGIYEFEMSSGSSVLMGIQTFVLSPAAAAIVAGEGVTPMKIEGQSEPNLGFWVDSRSYATWNVSFTKAGVYAVSVLAASTNATAISVGTEESRAQKEITSTGSYQNYVNITLGTINVPAAGPVNISLKAVPTNWKPINIRKVTLVPQ